MRHDDSEQVYVAKDGDGDELATAATYKAAADAIRYSLVGSEERDLGTLAVWQKSALLGETLPFSGYRIDTAAPDCVRSLALARATDEDLEDIEEGFEDNQFDVASREYLVLTDEEATAAAMEDCRQCVWAFNADWLAHYLPPGGHEAMEAIQKSGMCEDATDAILALLGNRADEAFEAALDTDGRGHFLACYDHEELEVTIGSETFYVYRRN